MNLYSWLWIGVSGVVGLGIGLYIAYSGMKALTKTLAKEAENELWRIKRNVIEAETRYLETHRRELAQIIIVRSPRVFETAFYRCADYEAEMRLANPERVNAEISALSHKFPYYNQFELLSVRHFIGYDDAAKNLSTECLLDRYTDISKWLILEYTREKSLIRLYGEDEIEQYSKNQRRRADMIFEERMKNAIEFYNCIGKEVRMHVADLEKYGYFSPYEDDKISIEVMRGHLTPDTRYGVHFKDTNEYGIYSSFYDGKEGKTYEEYYRTDRLFRQEIVLDF